ICDCKSQQAVGQVFCIIAICSQKPLAPVNVYRWRFIEINKNGVFRVGLLIEKHCAVKDDMNWLKLLPAKNR
ncbi:MAG: hypothetical protein JSV83_18515, partial [Desulfobacterales bacterium]